MSGLYNNISELIDITNSYDTYLGIKELFKERALLVGAEIAKLENIDNFHEYHFQGIDDEYEQIDLVNSNYEFDYYMSFPVAALWSPDHINDLLAKKLAKEQAKLEAQKQNEEFNRKAKYERYLELKAMFEGENDNAN